MEERSFQFLRKLLSIPGPSGHEAAPARAWRQEAEEFADEVRADVSGNSFGLVNPGGAPRVMLAGHIDEIGLMVRHIDDDGFVYFSEIGGWDPEVLIGQRVRILSRGGLVSGVIGKKAIHVQEKEERERASKIKDLWIDIGARDGDEARGRIRVGDAAVIAVDLMELPHGRIVSRSIDNRVGAFVVLEALRRLADDRPSAEVVAVATAQEEISWYSGGGARTGAYGLDPRAAFVVDVTHASDHPGADKKRGEHAIGSGPVITRGSAANPLLFERTVEVAEREGIPFTIEAAPRGTSTDADAIFTSRMGIPTALISIPNRYMHSPNELVALDDLENAAALLAATVASLTPEDDFIPR